MAKKKADTTEVEATKPQKVLIQPKKPGEWMQLIKKAADTGYRRLRIVIQFREKLMAGKPAKLDAAEAMLKARGLEDQIKAVPIDDPNVRAEVAAEVVSDEGKCEFHRRDGKPGLWMPTNNVKACLKENWSVLGFRNEIRGSRQDLAEGVFVVSDFTIEDKAEYNWLYLGSDEQLNNDATGGILTAVSHSVGPKGPVSSIKRHEYLVRPKLQFDVLIAKRLYEKRKPGETLPDEKLAETWAHAQLHGLGACRSQGYGTFDVLSVEELGDTDFDASDVQKEQAA